MPKISKINKRMIKEKLTESKNNPPDLLNNKFSLLMMELNQKKIKQDIARNVAIAQIKAIDNEFSLIKDNQIQDFVNFCYTVNDDDNNRQMLFDLYIEDLIIIVLYNSTYISEIGLFLRNMDSDSLKNILYTAIIPFASHSIPPYEFISIIRENFSIHDLKELKEFINSIIVTNNHIYFTAYNQNDINNFKLCIASIFNNDIIKKTLQEIEPKKIENFKKQEIEKRQQLNVLVEKFKLKRSNIERLNKTEINEIIFLLTFDNSPEKLLLKNIFLAEYNKIAKDYNLQKNAIEDLNTSYFNYYDVLNNIIFADESSYIRQLIVGVLQEKLNYILQDHKSFTLKLNDFNLSYINFIFSTCDLQSIPEIEHNKKLLNEILSNENEFNEDILLEKKQRFKQWIMLNSNQIKLKRIITNYYNKEYYDILNIIKKFDNTQQYLCSPQSRFHIDNLDKNTIYHIKNIKDMLNNIDINNVKTENLKFIKDTYHLIYRNIRFSFLFNRHKLLTITNRNKFDNDYNLVKEDLQISQYNEITNNTSSLTILNFIEISQNLFDFHLSILENKELNSLICKNIYLILCMYRFYYMNLYQESFYLTKDNLNKLKNYQNNLPSNIYLKYSSLSKFKELFTKNLSYLHDSKNSLDPFLLEQLGIFDAFFENDEQKMYLSNEINRIDEASAKKDDLELALKIHFYIINNFAFLPMIGLMNQPIFTNSNKDYLYKDTSATKHEKIDTDDKEQGLNYKHLYTKFHEDQNKIIHKENPLPDNTSNIYRKEQRTILMKIQK